MKPKKFIKILKDSYNRYYGVDEGGTHWRLDKLEKRGIKWGMVNEVRSGLKKAQQTLKDFFKKPEPA